MKKGIDCGYLNKDDSCNFTGVCHVENIGDCVAIDSNIENVMDKCNRNIKYYKDILKQLRKVIKNRAKAKETE